MTPNADLVQAAERGDDAAVPTLLARGASPNARREDGRPALTAALGDHVTVARLLVDTGQMGNVAMLREVLRAEPDLMRTNRFEDTALIPAADRGHVGYVREILKTGIDVHHVNNLGWTALLETVILGDSGARYTGIVRLLLGAGAW